MERRRAALADARIDLEHTAIRSPLNGTVISREVDVGQTVVARLQAPLLFTIAQDLRKMQVEASVDEADIGRIHPGRRAIFTVDTFPGRKFSGVVDQIRKAPHEVQNVVTYTVIVASDNTDLALLPGMTATVRVCSQRPERRFEGSQRGLTVSTSRGGVSLWKSLAVIRRIRRWGRWISQGTYAEDH